MHDAVRSESGTARQRDWFCFATAFRGTRPRQVRGRPKVIHTHEIDVVGLRPRSNNHGVDLDRVDKLAGLRSELTDCRTDPAFRGTLERASRARSRTSWRTSPLRSRLLATGVMAQPAVHSCAKIEYNSESRHAPLVNTVLIGELSAIPVNRCGAG
jgi:hypothetical protein